MAASPGAAQKRSRRAVVTATGKPTELVVSPMGIQSTPPFLGNELLYVTNTESDLFLNIDTASYYILPLGPLV